MLLAWPFAASAADTDPILTSSLASIDARWILTCTALVFFMQIGFLLYEAGMLRAKNASSVVIKNLVDITVVVISFTAFGAILTFGVSPLMVDFSISNENFDNELLSFLAYQTLVCCVAATIISGAVAERLKMIAYIAAAFAIAVVVYPVFAKLVVGNLYLPNTTAYLQDLGYIDQAGALSVHGTGAWFALACCWVLGPRSGRFDVAGRPIEIQSNSTVLAATGIVLMWIGWWGFNSGALPGGISEDAHRYASEGKMFLNTMLGAASGGLAGIASSMFKAGTVRPAQVFEGILAGLVAVTAGCAILPGYGAMLLGGLGGVCAISANHFILHRLRIDDALGVVGVHGVAAVVGVLGLALLAPVEMLVAQDRVAQLAIQAIAVLINCGWAFGVGLVLFFVLHKAIGIRVNAGAEEAGLNLSEHGTHFGFNELEDAIGRYIRQNAGDRMDADSAEQSDFARFIAALAGNVQRPDNQVEAGDSDLGLSRIADAAFEPICISVKGEIVAGNQSFETLIDKPMAHLRGKLLSTLFLRGDVAAIDSVLSDSTSASVTTRLEQNGLPVELHTRQMQFRGKQVQVTTIVDRSESVQAESRIKKLTHTDPLTALPNRAYFSRKTLELIAGTEESNSVLLFVIDINRFQEVNEIHGPSNADLILKVLGNRLSNAIREGDYCGRLGDDDLAIAQRVNNDPDAQVEFVQRLLAELCKLIPLGNKMYRPLISIGSARYPQDGRDLDDLFIKANVALREAKTVAGNASYRAFNNGLDVARQSRQLLAADLTAAVKQQELELYYQPRCDISSEKITGYEALVRWNHPTQGVVSPAQFIPIAEQTGLIIDIGKWVIEQGFATASTKLKGKHLSLNISPRQFLDPNLLDHIQSAQRRFPVDPAMIEFEVTEKAVLTEFQHTYQIIQELKALGYSISLDDFGTGYSSLAYLSRYSFDTIKLDRAFIADLPGHAATHSVVESVIQLCKSLGMRVVAEGVESEEQLFSLARMGCSEFQGYLISQPVPVQKLSSKMDETVTALFQDVDMTLVPSVAEQPA